MRAFIETETMNYSILPGRKGYIPFIIGVEEILRNDQDDVYVTKFLYPKIAQICGTTPASVERNFRELIRHAWEHGNPERFKKLFGFYDHNNPPSSKQFICTFARRLKIKWSRMPQDARKAWLEKSPPS